MEFPSNPARPIIANDVSVSDWRLSANCRGLDPDLFYSTRERSIQEAKRVCGECTVRLACLEQAIEDREEFGIWGGLSERERRRLRKRSRASQSN